MQKLQFKTVINAPREKVWNILWDDKTYREWTSVFSEGSSAQTDWQKGSKVLFTDGKGSGMVARIAENVPNEFMGIEHLGMVENGVEDTTSDKVKGWSGAREDYTLKAVDGKTELTVDMDINDEYKDMFSEMWPKAMESIRSIAERNN
jgi:hypothetical protein